MDITFWSFAVAAVIFLATVVRRIWVAMNGRHAPTSHIRKLLRRIWWARLRDDTETQKEATAELYEELNLVDDDGIYYFELEGYQKVQYFTAGLIVAFCFALFT